MADLTSRQTKGLQKLAKTLPAFFILRYFRSLQRSRSYHNVEYLQSIASQGAIALEREDLVPTYKEVLEVAKKLDELDLGVYVQGRKGNKTRIEWYEATSLGDVGQAAIPDVDEVIAELDLLNGHSHLGGAANFQDPEVVSLDPAAGGWMYSMETIKHSYQLRPGVFIEVLVPQDMTQVEAQRLGSFVGTLSMEG